MLTNMLTRGLASNTRSFSSRAMKVGKSSNMKMMSTLTGLGLGWSCLSQLNFGGLSLYGRINRAQCEAAAQASEPEPCCDLIKVGGIVLNNKMAGLIGAAAGVVIPGMNFLVWSFFVCDKHTKNPSATARNMRLFALAQHGNLFFGGFCMLLGAILLKMGSFVGGGIFGTIGLFNVLLYGGLAQTGILFLHSAFYSGIYLHYYLKDDTSELRAELKANN